jgi:hypothetical protein
MQVLTPCAPSSGRIWHGGVARMSTIGPTSTRLSGEVMIGNDRRSRRGWCGCGVAESLRAAGTRSTKSTRGAADGVPSPVG